MISKIGLRSGYHQVRIKENDMPKTVFRMRNGHYKFTMMPFELAKGPTMFMDIMNQVIDLSWMFQGGFH